MAPEPYTCELDPETKTTLKVFLFKNVTNVEVVRSNIINGIWRCAVIKPSLILDPLQVAVAANRAVVAEKLNMMVTRTVFAEILYNLSLTKNITQSLSKFGIDKGQNLLICFLVVDGTDESQDILPQIEGEPSSIHELRQFTSLKDVKSVYKLNSVKGLPEDDLLDIIVSRMVTKNFVSY